MSDELKRWQVSVWIGKDMDQPVTIYGDSIDELQHAVGNWLRKNDFTRLGNAHPDYEITRRFNYAYSDPQSAPLYRKFLDAKEHKWGQESMPEGWYWVQGDTDYWHDPQRLNDIESLITHFVHDAMIIEKGPDYQEVALTESNFPLHLISTVKRESKELLVNDMLQRGWYIVGLEYESEQDRTHQMTSRKIIFVLGHTEQNAP